MICSESLKGLMLFMHMVPLLSIVEMYEVKVVTSNMRSEEK